MREKYKILYQDEYIIAVDKPTGMLSIKDREDSAVNIFDIVKKDFEDLRLIHRLDRDTSGLILFAKNIDSQREFSKLFETHNISKKYSALVVGHPNINGGIIDNYLEENPNIKGTYRVARNEKGKKALSIYNSIEIFKKHALVEFEIKTGRTHQIRVHAQYIGCPLAFDPLYNPKSGILVSDLKSKYKETRDEEQSIIRRLSLHSYSLEFFHPFLLQNIKIVCPYPRDIDKALEILRKYK